ncbi:hypothetical protein PISL3812_05881 [Talaromyces islandicus]|uniref:Uncharacterized protein n=1 Tax=Talaromyces islandicus TaxID=28573 RepID=A0A0U1M137_TALIS|nr:hypothetical protein PISL3812_05881 [Talaromyces islandicus]
MSDSNNGPNLICTPLERTTSLDEEPKQPSNIPNALDHALRAIDLNSHTDSKGNENNNKKKNSAAAKFTSKDVKYLFSGAPHFMLEKGRHNHWYPHAIFPWDVGAVNIQDFWDREAMRHEAFTLGTLHAHLPVPGVVYHGAEEEGKEKGAKRSTFDLGIFEVPNMLSMNGKERGAVGIRHFLELPIADERRYHAAVSPKTRGGADLQAIKNMPLTQAFETLGHMRDAYSECNQDIVLDRRTLLHQGPEAWKRIGVRDVQTKKIVERLVVLSEFRTEALDKKKNMTILDRESVTTLHELLYTHVLYPPPKTWGHHHGKKQDEENLKCQIEVLTKVLAVKGAWLDFSLPDSRLRVGQVLWEMPVDSANTKDQPSPTKRNDADRKWLLLQLLLAGELLVRLDAIVRLAVLKPSKNISVSSQDVRELDKLRHGKVNWDVLFVQRFMDNLSLKYCPSTETTSCPPHEKTKHGLLSRFGRRQPQKPAQSQADWVSDSAWDCIFTPRHAERQLQGLSVFAAAIDWPNRDTVISQIRAHLDKDTYNTPLTSNQRQGNSVTELPAHQYLVPLQQPFSFGWLSRAWLTGLVLPGDSINALLMASILENDPSALSALGPLANLRGGFGYNGASWWSTKCIAGRVLAAADESKVCMGWVRIGKENLVPRNRQAPGAKLVDTWFSIAVRDVERKKGWSPRIRQGVKLAIESHPLGHGEVSGSTFTIPVDQQQQQQKHGFAVQIDRFELDTSEASGSEMVTAKEASISFSMTEETAATPISLCMPLTYNIHFVSSFPCRPPRGSMHNQTDFAPETDTGTANHNNLPGHPLHTSYSYKHISLSSLRPDTPLPEQKSKQDAEPVWILDARGSRDHEVFARAWCAAVGVDAVVGRVGRTCLACCVREARAVDVPVVIRV